jgi:hypothetical protein
METPIDKKIPGIFFRVLGILKCVSSWKNFLREDK